MDAQQQADQAHAKFDDEKSEFSGYLKLWKWINDARGGHGKEHKLSNRQYEQLLRQNFVNVRRVREWRDIHTQLHTVVAEHKWRLNTTPATYEQLHLSMLAGLLGNIGCKLDDEEVYLGARGIKFHRHPGAHLNKKPGRWMVAAELVETTRLFGRGLANIDPQWIEQVAGHLLKKQLLDPHWERKAAEVMALERATLYGLVIYSGRRVNFGKVDLHGAREVFIREALVAGQWDTTLPFLAANQKLVRKVEELEHKSRRQDVLVDDELIFAFYDQQVPADVYSGRQLRRLVPRGVQAAARSAQAHAGRADAPRGGGHHHQRFPQGPSAGRRGLRRQLPARARRPARRPDGDSAAVRAQPGQRRAGRMAGAGHAQGQDPGPAQEPAAAAALALCAAAGVGGPAGRSAGVARSVWCRVADRCLLRQVRDATSLDVKRTDFKLDMLSPHLFMNLRVVDEHGRQLGMGRNLGALKAELGAQARGAFQALAGLKLGGGPASGPAAAPRQVSEPNRAPALANAAQGAIKSVASQKPAAVVEVQRYTAWTFGELPELMEIRKGPGGGQKLIGFPALIDGGDAVSIEVFDEPEVAASRTAQACAGCLRCRSATR
jgi:ATP-dependent helicase HrpA